MYLVASTYLPVKKTQALANGKCNFFVPGLSSQVKDMKMLKAVKQQLLLAAENGAVQCGAAVAHAVNTTQSPLPL